MGEQGFTAVQLMQIIGDQKVRIIPDITVSGSGAGGGSMAEAMLGMLLRGQVNGGGCANDGGAAKSSVVADKSLGAGGGSPTPRLP
jgi:hypothetical protein